MKVGGLRVPVLHDVCIFCATRIQFSATRNRVSAQRRLFRTATVSKRPPEAALVRQEDHASEDVPRTSQNGQHHTGRWGQSQSWQRVPRFTAPSQQEPVKVTAQASPLSERQPAPSRVSRPENDPQIPQFSPHLQSPARVSSLDTFIGSARRDQSPSIRIWRCSCGFSNTQRDDVCRNCRAPDPEALSHSDDPDIARSWRHVKRNEENNRPVSEEQDMRPMKLVVDEALEEARKRRLEESKLRRFVGLKSQFKSQPLEFREVARESEFDFEGGKGSRNSEFPSFDITNRLGGEYKRVRQTSNPQSLPPESLRAPTHVSDASYEIVRGVSRGSSAASDAPSDRARGFRIWRPGQIEIGSESDKRPLMQQSYVPHESMVSSTPRYDPSGRQQVMTPSKEPQNVSWKAWRHDSSTEIDSAEILRGESQAAAPTSSQRDSPRNNEEYISMAEQRADSDALLPHRPSEDMGASQQRTSADRMARRLQELDEESKKKSTRIRFDPDRVRRTTVNKTRKYLESQTDDIHPEDDIARVRQERKKERKRQQAAEKLQGPPTPIYLPEFISVANLSGALRIRIEDFTQKMKNLGFEETSNDFVLDAETAGLIAAEFNFEPIVNQQENEDLKARPAAEDKSKLPPRPPVVTIMGHVDHGKTTLLDWLRKSSIAASEYGGITQHIGAFSVLMPSGRAITFLDTPGHAAFEDMRKRGANVTDIVILVVAADDSVKPQTVEAIKHAQAANVPMIVAVNKIDKQDADVEKVKQDLARYGVQIEDYGGETQVVCVSGKTGQGMETLEESAIALADIIDMRAETDGQAEGWILEATTKKAGRVATVLVRRGTLHAGDIIVAGTTWARVRSLRNEAGVQVTSAGPGTPVEIDGWKDQPTAGDEVLQAEDEQHARSVVDVRQQATKRAQMAEDITAVNEARRLEQERREAAEAADANVGGSSEVAPKQTIDNSVGLTEVPLFVKADVSGSVEAVLASVLALGNTSVRASILRSGVGSVSETDVSHAASAQGHIVAFNIAIEPHIRRAAEASGVKILEQNVIYRLTDLVRGLLEDYLEPIRTKKVLGEAEVAQVFDINVKGRQVVPVAGCRVRNGVIARNARVVVKRGQEDVFNGALASLKNRKVDATEMRKGTECGLAFEGWTDFRVGDQVQSYEEKVEKRTLQ